MLKKIIGQKFNTKCNPGTIYFKTTNWTQGKRKS